MKDHSIDIKSENYIVRISDNIDDLKFDWDKTSRKSIYFNSAYLVLLEKHGPIGYSYYYVIVYEGAEAIGVFYFQRKTIDLHKDFRVHTHSKNLFKKFAVFAQKQLFKLVNHEFLINGNVLLTGEYAYYFVNELSVNKFSMLSNHVYDLVINFIHERSGKKIQSILAKDFYVGANFKVSNFQNSEFTEFKVQPDMVLKLNPEWKNFDDYINAVKSKYRVKFKKVLSKGKELDFVSLDLIELEKEMNAMYDLYCATSDKASFSLFKLQPDYFLELKKALPEYFHAIGVYLDKRLVAFCTVIINGKNADGHFLGYDVKLNSQYQIYFNILLKLIEKSILYKVDNLNLSRTALEIKSSVGAEPHAMNIYLRHNNKLFNKILPALLDKVVPKVEWIQRVPFK